MRQDHHRTEEHRTQAGQHHAPVDTRQARAVDLRGTDDRLVDTAQAGEEHRHDETRGLPHGRDHQAVDHPVRVDQPVETEAFPAPVPQEFVQAHAGVEQPFPGSTGDDHRERHRVQVNGADKTFATDFLVEENRQHHANHQGDTDEHPAEQCQVLARHPPAVVVEQPLVLSKARPVVARQERGRGERQYKRPQDVAVEAHQHDEHAWRQHQFG